MRSKRERLSRPPPGNPELASSERVTIASLPSSAMAPEAPSGSRDARASDLTELPLRWVDRLLSLASELPALEGELAVAQAVVEAVQSLLPHHPVAARIVLAGQGSDGRAARVVGASYPLHERAEPSLQPSGEGTSFGNGRLFPAYAHERVVVVDGSGGSSLHLASDGVSLEADLRAGAGLLERAARVLSRGLAEARLHARAARDAAELGALHSQIVQVEKLASLGQIAAGVVHELNNPLTSIVAYTDFLIRRVTARSGEGREREGDPDELDRLRRIAESAGRMLRFTRDLVSYARPSSELPVQVSVHVVIEQALAFCEHILSDAGAVVDRRFAASLPAVRGKPEQLAQVFVNLITNACHALPASGGRLTVATESLGDRARITLADNGHGILPEHLPHVFTPFFTTKGNGLGTGLGLTIVKSIVDAHDGQIAAESSATSGTSFVITLPSVVRNEPR